MRCSICNRVSSLSVETNTGDFQKGHHHFSPDPDNPLFFICTPCTDAITEVRNEFRQDDRSQGEVEYVLMEL